MPHFDAAPAPPPLSANSVARGVWCWPALLPGVAVVLDAVRPLQPGAGALGPLWLDLAAITCLIWATTGAKRARPGDWATPMDGRAVAGIVLALLHVIARSGVGAPMQWLHQFSIRRPWQRDSAPFRTAAAHVPLIRVDFHRAQ